MPRYQDLSTSSGISYESSTVGINVIEDISWSATWSLLAL